MPDSPPTRTQAGKGSAILVLQHPWQAVSSETMDGHQVAISLAHNFECALIPGVGRAAQQQVETDRDQGLV